jgi:hypothetical protein
MRENFVVQMPPPPQQKITLSGLLNFIDGLCGPRAARSVSSSSPPTKRSASTRRYSGRAAWTGRSTRLWLATTSSSTTTPCSHRYMSCLTRWMQRRLRCRRCCCGARILTLRCWASPSSSQRRSRRRSKATNAIASRTSKLGKKRGRAFFVQQHLLKW